jgi:hypothetical protein
MNEKSAPVQKRYFKNRLQSELPLTVAPEPSSGPPSAGVGEAAAADLAEVASFSGKTQKTTLTLRKRRSKPNMITRSKINFD